MKKQDREFAFQELVNRSLAQYQNKFQLNSFFSAEHVINDTLFHEKQRLKREAPSKKILEERIFWRQISNKFTKIPRQEQENLLKNIISRYAQEIIGGYDPRLQNLVSKILPLGIRSVFNKLSPLNYFENTRDQAFGKFLEISGKVEEVQSLAKMGTLIYTPTHHSNFDSIALGYSLFQISVPPVIYGAGLNLFSNPAISFMMNNLGAYKVDRKKTNELYKATLKNYTGLSLEMGYHNLFFPGGTRSRSGAIERKLKLGLLGTGHGAYCNNLINGKTNPNIYIIPLTVNYGLGLEAETLIEDYLKETGKSRYIIVDDDSSKHFKVLRFMKKVGSLHSKVHIHFGQPLDLFGNKVEKNGKSYDNGKREIDIAKYFYCDGKITQDTQRDMQYTQILGKKILREFERGNVILSTNILGRAFWNVCRIKNSQWDRYRVLRQEQVGIPYTELIHHMEILKAKLLEMHQQGEIILDKECQIKPASDLYLSAKKQLNSYHGNKILWSQDHKLFSKNLKTIYYYSNKLKGYGKFSPSYD